MNVEWISRLPGPVRAAGYFGLQRAIGSHILGCWRELKSWERMSPTQLDEAVENRLGHLLERATKESEYYRQLGLVRSPNETAVEFLARFPILKREQLRSHFAKIVIDRLCDEIRGPDSVSRRRYDWLVVKTGGTTGVPTSVIHDARFRDCGRATRLYSQELCGFPLGTRYFRLWGSEQDLLQQQEKLDRRLLRNLLGEIPMNAFRAKEAELERHLEAIRTHPEVRHMMAYVDASVSLATYIEQRGLPAPRLNTIMGCAGTVTKEWRAILERVFSAEVFDKYGSRECADIACECSAHAGLHIYSSNVYVEVADSNGRRCAPGEPGTILVTLLNNASFPMVRYQIGDIGTMAPAGPCSCGRPFPRLQSLQGREDEMLLTEDGTLLSSVFVRHFVGVSLNRQLIREWQFEQTDRRRFIFRYVSTAGSGLEENLRDLDAGFRKALGSSAEIEMQPVAEIPPSPTGKVRWIVNRCRTK